MKLVFFLVLTLLASQMLVSASEGDYFDWFGHEDTSKLTINEFVSRVKSYGGGSVTFAGSRPEVIYGCGDDFLQDRLSEGNIKHMDFYDDSLAFVINAEHSMADFVNILKTTTLSIWENNGFVCDTYVDSENSLCAYPMLVIYEGDIYGTDKFIRQKGIQHVFLVNSSEVPGEVLSQLKNNVDIDFLEDNYYSFWDSYDVVVLSERNYEAMVHATIIASKINAPLVIVDEPEAERLISNKKIITVANQGILPQNPTYSRMFSRMKDNLIANIDVQDKDSLYACYNKLEIHKERNPSETFTWPSQEKIIIFNINDIKDSYCEEAKDYVNSGKSGIGLRLSHPINPTYSEHAFCADSLMVPYLAVARDQRVLNVPLMPLPGRDSDIAAFDMTYNSSIHSTSMYDSASKEFPEILSKKIIMRSYINSFENKDEVRLLKASRLTKDAIKQYFSLSSVRESVNPIWYTFIGSPRALPYSLFVETKSPWRRSLDVSRVDAAFYILAKKDEEEKIRRGRILGVTLGDTAALIMKGLFLDSILDEEGTFYATRSNDIPTQKSIVQKSRMMDDLLNLKSCFYTEPKLLDPVLVCSRRSDLDDDTEPQESFLKRSFNYYDDHGLADEIPTIYSARYSQEFEADNSPFIGVEACLTLEYFSSYSLPVGMVAIREGARGFLGSAGINYMSESSRFLTDVFLQRGNGVLFMGELEPLMHETLIRNSIMKKVRKDNGVSDRSQKRGEYNKLREILIGDPMAKVKFSGFDGGFNEKNLPHKILLTEINTTKPFNNLYNHFYQKKKDSLLDRLFEQEDLNNWGGGLAEQVRATKFLLGTKINVTTYVLSSYPIKARMYLGHDPLMEDSYHALSTSEQSFDNEDMVCEKLTGPSVDDISEKFDSLSKRYIYKCKGTIEYSPDPSLDDSVFGYIYLPLYIEVFDENYVAYDYDYLVLKPLLKPRVKLAVTNNVDHSAELYNGLFEDNPLIPIIMDDAPIAKNLPMFCILKAYSEEERLGSEAIANFKLDNMDWNKPYKSSTAVKMTSSGDSSLSRSRVIEIIKRNAKLKNIPLKEIPEDSICFYGPKLVDSHSTEELKSILNDGYLTISYRVTIGNETYLSEFEVTHDIFRVSG